MNTRQSEITGYILEAFYLMQPKERIEVLKAVGKVYCPRCGKDHPHYFDLVTMCQCATKAPRVSQESKDTSDQLKNAAIAYADDRGWGTYCAMTKAAQEYSRSVASDLGNRGEGLLGVGDC